MALSSPGCGLGCLANPIHSRSCTRTMATGRKKLALNMPVSEWWHNETGEDNPHRHIKRQIVGREVVVAVTEGCLGFRGVKSRSSSESWEVEGETPTSSRDPQKME